MSAELEQQCVNAIRFLSVDMVQKADSGHPGLPLERHRWPICYGRAG